MRGGLPGDRRDIQSWFISLGSSAQHKECLWRCDTQGRIYSADKQNGSFAITAHRYYNDDRDKIGYDNTSLIMSRNEDRTYFEFTRNMDDLDHHTT